MPKKLASWVPLMPSKIVTRAPTADIRGDDKVGHTVTVEVGSAQQHAAGEAILERKEHLRNLAGCTIDDANLSASARAATDCSVGDAVTIEVRRRGDYPTRRLGRGEMG